MDIYKLLCSLCEKKGISGNEGDIAEFSENILKKYCKKTEIDKFNNVYGFVPCEKKGAKKLMIAAHLDRIGLMVKHIDENGFTEFSAVGGIDPRVLPSAEVKILGKKEVFGVIGAKPPHLRAENDGGAPKIEDMLIDVGMDGKKAKEFISVGDFAYLPSKPARLLNNRAAGAAFDNRCGMAAVIEFLERYTAQTAKVFDLCVVFTSGEETGLLGANSAAAKVRPDYCITVDVTFGKTKELEDFCGAFELGCGAVILRGGDVSFDDTLGLIRCAEKNDIPYEIEVCAESSGTDASAVLNKSGGAKNMIISIPLKYMHQTVETVCLDDISAVSELLLKAAKGGFLCD